MKTIVGFTTACLLCLQLVTAQNLEIKVNENLQGNTAQLVREFDQIPQERKDQLVKIGEALISKKAETNEASALFVCTHNSRRSHIADTWFKFGLVYYGVSGFASYSGGLEATAFNPSTLAALERVGFTLAYNKKVDNPVVSITPGNFPVWQMKSKKYTHQINPKSDFMAIMVCSDADKSCPVMAGASGRFSLPYDDPRYYDNTPSEELKYDETVATIGREMLYLIHYIKREIILTIESSIK